MTGTQRVNEEGRIDLFKWVNHELGLLSLQRPTKAEGYIPVFKRLQRRLVRR